MSKFYYANYETAKTNLNLQEKNEYSDRINLAYCNQLVKDVVVDAGVSETEKQQHLQALVLKLFTKYGNNLDDFSHNESEMAEVYEVVRDAVVWG